MKRDMAIVNAILKAYEKANPTVTKANKNLFYECETIKNNVIKELQIDDLQYQSHFNLAVEAGFLKFNSLSHQITWLGYNYLDSLPPE